MGRATDGTEAGADAEALGHEREEYPDPDDYPLPDPNGEDILDGSTPDADLQVEKAADADD